MPVIVPVGGLLVFRGGVGVGALVGVGVEITIGVGVGVEIGLEELLTVTIRLLLVPQ